MDSICTQLSKLCCSKKLKESEPSMCEIYYVKRFLNRGIAIGKPLCTKMPIVYADFNDPLDSDVYEEKHQVSSDLE